MSNEDGCCRQMIQCVSHSCCYLIVAFLLPCLIYVLIMNPYPSPHFTLHDVKLYLFNVSIPTSTINSMLKINISSKNTHHNTGYYLNELNFYVSYKNQQITPPTTLHPRYLLGSEVWSLYIIGTDVAVPHDVAAALAQDVTDGKVLISVEVTGLLSSTSGSYDMAPYEGLINATCSAYIIFGNKNDSKDVSSAVKYPFVEVEGCRDEA